MYIYYFFSIVIRLCIMRACIALLHLHRLKTYTLTSTFGEECLNRLALLFTHRYIPINMENIQLFVKQKNRSTFLLLLIDSMRYKV